MASGNSLGQRWNAYRASKTALAWACVGSIAATAIIGFTWGGWVTGGSARDMAANAAADARSELVAALCVERFNAAENVAVRLEELKKLQSWSRRDFIEKGGWVVTPGKAGSTTKAANLCATQLLAVSSAAPASVAQGG